MALIDFDSLFSVDSSLEDANRRRQVQRLYIALSPVLVDYAARKLGDEDAAEEAVQDAFLAILEGRYPVPAVDVRRKLGRVVKAICIARKRRRALVGRFDRIARAALRTMAREEELRAFRESAASRRDDDEDDEESEEERL